MCDNCKTLSVSGTVHIHIAFHFNEAENAENKVSQMMQILINTRFEGCCAWETLLSLVSVSIWKWEGKNIFIGLEWIRPVSNWLQVFFVCIKIERWENGKYIAAVC